VKSIVFTYARRGGDTVHRADIMRRMNLRSCIVVSDGYHIYRVKKTLENQGLKVYESQRPEDRVRQALGYGLWRVGIRI
jgi:uncharacterized SAM-binding protein YcdF (DUF218 family)